jgi:3-oxoacyl-[acyl-carrier-protein] synthase-3
MNREVYITRTAALLPGEPVGNDEIEQVLGQVGERPSRARAVVLRSNGIRQRHYAIDRQTGHPSHTNAQLSAGAIRALGAVGPVDCLAVGTSTPDQIVPNHGVMVHGELGWPALEVVSLAGICLSGAAALKHAWMAVRCGEARRAVSCASELISPNLMARHFQPELEHQAQALDQRPELAFEKDFLRWMLSDGAAAVLLEPAPTAALSLRVDWIALSSAAHELPACMYGGARRNADASLTPWQFLSPEEWLAESTFTVKQDVRLLNEHVVRATLVEPLRRALARHPLQADQIDWFLPHISSMYFAAPVERGLHEAGLPVPRERWFTNLERCGNTGSASPFIMLDELTRSGRLLPDQRVLIFVPESGRFSSGFIHLTAVRGDLHGA